MKKRKKFQDSQDEKIRETIIEMAMKEFNVPRNEVTEVMIGIIKVYYYDQLFKGE